MGHASDVAKPERYQQRVSLKEAGASAPQRLSAAELFHRPDDPRAFLLKQLEALKSGEDMLFTEEDLKTMFGMFDIVRKGTITADQHKQAMTTLGVDSPADPAGATVTFEEFSTLAKEGLTGSARSYVEGH